MESSPRYGKWMKMDGFYRKSSRDTERPFSVSMFADGEGWASKVNGQCGQDTLNVHIYAISQFNIKPLYRRNYQDPKISNC